MMTYMTETLNDLPTVSFPELWHVGSLRPQDKKEVSLEGQGLSVSIHPEEWSRIARLDGPTWQVHKEGHSFLDYRNLSTTTLEQIAAWGIEQGYVVRQPVFIASWVDDEWDQMLSTAFLDVEEAVEQVEDTEGTIEEQVCLVATGAFPDPTVRSGDIDPSEILSVLWAAEQGFDGVWWNDIYDPLMLSAPRGVICVDRVCNWKFVQR